MTDWIADGEAGSSVRTKLNDLHSSLGVAATTDNAPTAALVNGGNAWPHATGNNRNGASLFLAGGIGARFFTIEDFSALSGASVTLTTDGVDVTFTEGVDWTASTSNGATATSLASAIGASADAVSNIVYIAPVADALSMKLSFSSNGAYEPIASFSDNGSGGTTVTIGGGNGAPNGAIVDIDGTTNYNHRFTASNAVFGVSFDIATAFISNDATGNYYYDGIATTQIADGSIDTGTVTKLGKGAAYNLQKEDITSGTAVGENAAADSRGNHVVAVGKDAASGNLAINVTAIGEGAASGNGATGQGLTVVGRIAGQNNLGNIVTAVGSGAAINNTGNALAALGDDSANGNTGNNVTAIGASAGSANTGSDVTAIGSNAAFSNHKSNVVVIGKNAVASADNTVQLGDENVSCGRIGAPMAVASLPSAATVGAGYRAFVTDANQTLAADLGSTVTGTGGNTIPVWSDGTNWKVG